MAKWSLYIQKTVANLSLYIYKTLWQNGHLTFRRLWQNGHFTFRRQQNVHFTFRRLCGKMIILHSEDCGKMVTLHSEDWQNGHFTFRTLWQNGQAWFPHGLAHMSSNVRKLVLGVFNQAGHKPTCTVTVIGKKLKISDLRRGIV